MPYRKQIFSSGNYYHIYNRGINRENIFFEKDNYIFFLKQLRKYFFPDTASIVAYCLMPNHYHLLIFLKQTNLAQTMQKFTLSYAKAINKKFARVGSLFQGPFKAVQVNKDEYLLHLSRYIHLNPVQANLVRKPEDWVFSSYRDYIGLRNGTLIDNDVVMSQFANKIEYKKFAEGFRTGDLKHIKNLILE